MRALFAIALMIGPAMAQAGMPTRMTCIWAELCRADDICEQVAEGPTFTLMFDGQDWLWDPAAQWNGFPILMAQSPEDALARHLTDPQLGLALIPASTSETGTLILDGFRLGRPPEPAMSDQRMRHLCEAAPNS